MMLALLRLVDQGVLRIQPSNGEHLLKPFKHAGSSIRILGLELFGSCAKALELSITHSRGIEPQGGQDVVLAHDQPIHEQGRQGAG